MKISNQKSDPNAKKTLRTIIRKSRSRKQLPLFVMTISSLAFVSLVSATSIRDSATTNQTEQLSAGGTVDLTFEESPDDISSENHSNDQSVRVSPEPSVSTQATIRSSGNVAPDVTINGQKIDVPANGTVEVTEPSSTPAPEQSSSSSSVNINIRTSGESNVDQDVSSDVKVNSNSDVRIRTRNR